MFQETINQSELRLVQSITGGWYIPTPLKNMKVSWDDDSQYMENMFQTTNQIISTEQSYWIFRLFGNIRLHRHLCTEKLNVEESKWIPTSSHGLAETQWDKVGPGYMTKRWKSYEIMEYIYGT